MTSGWELQDENDELLYLIAIGALGDQLKRIVQNPDYVFQDFFWEDELLLLAPLFIPGIAQVIEMGARNSVANTPLAFVDIEVFRNAAHFAETYSYNLIKDINSTTRDKIGEAVRNHYLEGTSLQDLKDQLEPFFGRNRASLIAVSESTRAHMKGTELTAEQLMGEGYVVTEIWQTGFDGCAEVCEPRNNQPKGSNWFVSEPAHPGCDCWIVNKVMEL